MQYFRIYTLIDITETKQYRKEDGRELEKKQQQNFSSLLQTISLRVNPSYDRSPVSSYLSKEDNRFGTRYQGDQKVWKFDFHIEYDGGFTDEQGNPFGLLVKDIHLVPVIANLTESVTLELSAFDTVSDEYKNTIIEIDTDK
jgi:hypothetical protein